MVLKYPFVWLLKIDYSPYHKKYQVMILGYTCFCDFYPPLI